MIRLSLAFLLTMALLIGCQSSKFKVYDKNRVAHKIDLNDTTAVFILIRYGYCAGCISEIGRKFPDRKKIVVMQVANNGTIYLKREQSAIESLGKIDELYFVNSHTVFPSKNLFKRYPETKTPFAVFSDSSKLMTLKQSNLTTTDPLK